MRKVLRGYAKDKNGNLASLHDQPKRCDNSLDTHSSWTPAPVVIGFESRHRDCRKLRHSHDLRSFLLG
jgi:hypothetical protein